MENMSLSDIAAVTRGNDDGDGWGGNGAWWIIVLFLFMFGAGVQETQMFRNGNAVPGAHALDTVATVGDDVSQAFHAIVTVPKNAPTATLNFKSANATSVRVANVIVVKVA